MNRYKINQKSEKKIVKTLVKSYRNPERTRKVILHCQYTRTLYTTIKCENMVAVRLFQ